MKRLFLNLTLLALVLLSGLVIWKKGYIQNAWSWRHEYFTGGGGSSEIEEIENETMSSIMGVRNRLGSSVMAIDPELQAKLHLLINETSTPDLDLLMANLEKEMPQYLHVAVGSFRSLMLSDLKTRLLTWKELPNANFNHFALVIRRSKMGIGWNGHVIAGHKAPHLTPENLTQIKTQDPFYSRCELCNHVQSCIVSRHSRSLLLRCGHCQKVYSAMASDARGNFRYVNEYLTGYEPPAHFPKNISRLQELMVIWRTVTRTCRYVTDEGENDSWQTALETQTLGQGDCEDSSILLTDWLINRGFDARVALGRFAERGGHAWVVVNLEGKTYLLESTEGAKANTPPLLAEVGSRYTPDLLFDRDGYYVPKAPQKRWNGDYWSDQIWQKVIPRPNPAFQRVTAEVAKRHQDGQTTEAVKVSLEKF